MAPDLAGACAAACPSLVFAGSASACCFGRTAPCEATRVGFATGLGFGVGAASTGFTSLSLPPRPTRRAMRSIGLSLFAPVLLSDDLVENRLPNKPPLDFEA